MNKPKTVDEKVDAVAEYWGSAVYCILPGFVGYPAVFFAVWGFVDVAMAVWNYLV